MTLPARAPRSSHTVDRDWNRARGWTRSLAIAGALLGPTPAGAAPPEPSAASTSDPDADPDADANRVLIRVLPADPPMSARLRAELDLLGFEVVEDTRERAPAGPGLLDELVEADTAAGVEIVVGPERIEVWVADRDTSKLLSRRLDVAAEPELGDPRTVAIAAVELLRASRLVLREPSPAPPAPATPDPSDDPGLEPRPRPTTELELPLTGALSLAPMVGGSPGGFGVTTHVELAGRWAPLPRFGLRVSAWIPTLGNSIAVSDGRVRMFVGMAFIEPQLRLPSLPKRAPWFHPELGLGLGLAVIGFEGIANEGLRSDTRVLAGFAGHAHLGLGFAVRPRLWIRLDGYTGVVQPQPRIESTAGAVEAGWGLPFATGSLGVEIWL